MSKISIFIRKTGQQVAKPGAEKTYLGSTGDHVLDEITMSRGINDGDIVLASLELPEGNINGDTTLTLSLQLVQNPGVLEGALAHLYKNDNH